MLAILRRHDRYAKPQACAEGLDTITLTRKAYRRPGTKLVRLITRSQVTAVRCALASLALEGAVIRLGALRSRRNHWRINVRRA